MEIDIFKFILNNQGSVDTEELLYNLCDASTLVEIVCKNDKIVSCLCNGQPKLVVRSRMRLCWAKECQGCGGLHMCMRFFLTGTCQFDQTRRVCRYSHNLHSDYNEQILKECGLETLTSTELLRLLLQSNNTLLPPVCHNYNNVNGCQDDCKRLHICERFLSRDCSCFRTHDFYAPQPLKRLQEKRIPDNIIKTLKSVYANKQALWYADQAKKQNQSCNNQPINNSDIVENQNSGDESDSSSEISTNQNKTSNREGGGQRRRGRRGKRGGVRGKKGNKQQEGASSYLDWQETSLVFVNSEYKPAQTQSLLAASSVVYTTNGNQAFNNGQNPPLTGLNTTSSNQRPSHEQRDKTEICMFFIKGHCKHEDRCVKAHDKMPYRWEIKWGGKWTSMPENEKIEKDYCDPQNTHSSTCIRVYFATMTCENNEVRRLSTMNSVEQPDYLHTTEWLWYWEDEYGKWYQYAAVTSEHQLASITSRDLEDRFVQNNKDVVRFTDGSQAYELSFQDMIQTNVKYGTKKLVSRRPQFVSAAEVLTKRKRPANSITVPDYWDKTQILPTEYKRVTLQTTSAEYKEIQELFCQTMKTFDILKIERIQNKVVWEAFELHRNHMKIKNGGQLVREKKLFHGTKTEFVNAICATSIDWRVCGVHGTAYGQGSYFARDARYSHSYTGDSDVRFMFVSRVLVGDYTKGHSEYKLPPSKDGGDVNLYDSCVDDICIPSIFVVFHQQKIYPEYLLQYKVTGTTANRHTAHYFQPAAPTMVTSAPPLTASVSAATGITSPSKLASKATTKAATTTGLPPVLAASYTTSVTRSPHNLASRSSIASVSSKYKVTSSTVSVTKSPATLAPTPATRSITRSPSDLTSKSSTTSVTYNLGSNSSTTSPRRSVTNPSSASATTSVSGSPYKLGSKSSTTPTNLASTTTSVTKSPSKLASSSSTTSVTGSPYNLTSASPFRGSFRFAAATLQPTTTKLTKKKEKSCVIA